MVLWTICTKTSSAHAAWINKYSLKMHVSQKNENATYKSKNAKKNK